MPATFDFYTNTDVSTDPVSLVFTVPCSQDMRFLIQNVLTGVTGTPKLFIEESVDQVVWTSMVNPVNCESYFELNQINSPIGIKDNYFMGFYMRLRIENNGATGTMSSKMGYKTKV